MLPKTNWRNAFDKSWNSLNGYLDDLGQAGSGEALHQLRVQLKKLRAILGLYTGKTGKTERDTFRRLFRAAGEVRSAGIHLELLRQLNAPAPLLQAQANQYMLLERQFRASTGKHKKALRKVRDTLRKRFTSLHSDELAWRFLERADRIGVLLSATGGTADWHEARKQIKQLLYAYAVAGKPLQGRLPLDTIYLDRLQEQIGDWHDAEVTRVWLATQGSSGKELLRKLQQRKARQERSIRKLIRAYLPWRFGLTSKKKGTT